MRSAGFPAAARDIRFRKRHAKIFSAIKSGNAAAQGHLRRSAASFHRKTVIEMKWSEEIKVRPSDTDINGIASAGAVLSYIQNAGYYQHFYVGPSMEDIRKNGMAFILSRIALRIYEPLHACDRLTAESWPCKISGASFMRSARVMRGDCVAAESISSWALVDINSGKLCRADSVKLGFGTDEPVSPDVPLRFSVPKELELKKRGSRLITYSDADSNGHMTNTAYPDMLCDFLPSDGTQSCEDIALGVHGDHRPLLTGKRVTAISLSFLSEARIGEQITVLCGRAEDGVYYFRTKHGDAPDAAVGVEARMEIGGI